MSPHDPKPEETPEETGPLEVGPWTAQHRAALSRLCVGLALHIKEVDPVPVDHRLTFDKDVVMSDGETIRVSAVRLRKLTHAHTTYTDPDAYVEVVPS